MYIGIHIKYRLFLSDFNETWIFSIDLKKYSNIKIQESVFSGSRGGQCGRTARHDEANSRFSQFRDRT